MELQKEQVGNVHRGKLKIGPIPGSENLIGRPVIVGFGPRDIW